MHKQLSMNELSVSLQTGVLPVVLLGGALYGVYMWLSYSHLNSMVFTVPGTNVKQTLPQLYACHDLYQKYLTDYDAATTVQQQDSINARYLNQFQNEQCYISPSTKASYEVNCSLYPSCPPFVYTEPTCVDYVIRLQQFSEKSQQEAEFFCEWAKAAAQHPDQAPVTCPTANGYSTDTATIGLLNYNLAGQGKIPLTVTQGACCSAVNYLSPQAYTSCTYACPSAVSTSIKKSHVVGV